MNDDAKSFEELALSFAARQLANRRESSDRYPFGPFDDTVLAKADELGFLGITVPEDLGGIGQGISTLCVVLEGICRTDASLGAVIFTHTLSQDIILRSGSVDLLCSPSSRGRLIACSAYSNPDEHKDPPRAEKGKKGYTLTGSAGYVVLAPIAAYALLPAKIPGQEGYSFFMVDLSQSGVKASEPVFSLGVHACPVADLALDGAEAELAGREGAGAAYFGEAAGVMSAAAAAMSLGIMRGSFDYALAYSNEREQGGCTIVNWSMIKTILADMAVQTRIGDMAVYGACSAIENRLPGWDIVAKSAALHVQDAACRVTTEGVQVLGGYGYMKDYGQEKRFRDAHQMKTLLGMAPLRKVELLDRINGK
ncbi:MAG TPA: acyl-CoA dehydrogenase family protein [Deltaproteobacteria bacterium]|nr:acyl-CoA dehydrogenase family protein [Deltaproteobacteria bacterium]